MAISNDTFVIKGATLYDGSGNPPRIADVAVTNGLIKAVEPAGTINTTGVKTYAAKSLALAPGFIDAHSHSDMSILHTPTADSRVSQGVTTEVIGNCGDSDAIRHVRGAFEWDDVAGYEKAVNACEPAVNITTLCGQGTIRDMVMHDSADKPSPEQLDAMKDILRKALQQGAAGLSSGLWYIPGKFADTDEVKALAALLKDTGKPYASHVRSEGDQLIEAAEEAIEIAAAGSGRLEFSHIKTADRRNWHKLDELFKTLAEGRRHGLQITADRYPYLYSETGLRMTLTTPFDNIPNIKKYLAENPEAETEITAKWHDNTPDWDKIIFGNSPDDEDKPLLGLTIAQIAAQQNSTPEKACLDILKHSTDPTAFFGKMCAENLENIYRQPWVMPGSDGYAIGLDYNYMRSHPRSFGTCPRFFKLVSQHTTYQEVVRRMTSLPADVFNLKRRGRILPGYIADLVIFDPEWMDANEDYSNPHQFSTGVLKTFVAGGLAFDRANPMQRGRFGQFVRVPSTEGR